LNLARNDAAQRKAIEAQIADLIEKHKLDRHKCDIGSNFTVERKIKKLYASPLQQKLLAAGSVALVRNADVFELVPAQVARKIAKRPDAEEQHLPGMWVRALRSIHMAFDKA